MYLLVWSPAPWRELRVAPPPGLSGEDAALWKKEQGLIEAFVADLPAVRRALAHVPVAMIFVPCKDGLSHNPAENIDPVHAAMGCAMLKDAVLATANPVKA